MPSVGSWKRRGFVCTKLAGELSVLLDIATMEIQVVTPVFDNNSNLLFDMDDGQLAYAEWHILRLVFRPGTDFAIAVRALLTDVVGSNLINLWGAFKPHLDIPVEREDIGKVELYGQ